MACSKEILDDSVQLVEKGYDEEDLTTCSICLSMIDEPKALPCLHTFCLKCLSEWAKSTKTVTCPICRKDWTLPAGGVAGLESNFLVNKLKDRKTVRKKLASKGCIIPCTSCDGSNQPAVARCVECDDFLCENCLKPHKTMRKLKGHHTFTLDELQAGKADPVEKTEYCSKHQGQVLWIYCETCGMLICRDCTVFDHCKPEHNFVDIHSAAKNQRANIEELAEECKNLAIKVDEAIQNDTEAASELNASVETAMRGLSLAYEETKSSILMQLETNYKSLASEIKNEGARGRKEIDTHTEELNVLRSRLRTALKTASELTKTGSDCDVAQMYASLTSSLKYLKGIKKPPVQKARLDRVKFGSPENEKDPLRLGSVTSETQKTGEDVLRDCKLHRLINCKRSERISDITLANGKVKEMYVVHEFMGAFKVSNEATFIPISKPSNPYVYGCAVHRDGTLFFTADDKHVYKFNSNVKYVSKFDIFTGREALGITMASGDNDCVVGEITQKHISVHSKDGVIKLHFSAIVHPWFMSVSSREHLAVSCRDSCCNSVAVLDITQNGILLFQVNTPHGIGNWSPKGVCWSKDDVLFVVNSVGENGVHQFTSSGEYVGCIVTGFNSPTCLTISDDDELIVADSNVIKIYH